MPCASASSRIFTRSVPPTAAPSAAATSSSRATEGIEKLDGYFRDYLPGLFTAVFLPLLILLVVLPLDLLTFIVLLITAPLIPFFMALIGMAAGALAQRQFFEMRYLGAHFLDVMQGLTTLKLFNRSRYQIETIRRITDQFRAATMRVLRVAFLSALTLELLATLSVAIVAVEIGVRLLDGGIGFRAGAVSAGDRAGILPAAARVGREVPQRHRGQSRRRTPLCRAGYAARPNCRPNRQTVPQQMAIRFEQVAVSYDDGARPALRDLSFAIEPGERVALVGASGSGKTTIANLLLRLRPAGRRANHRRRHRLARHSRWRIGASRSPGCRSRPICSTRPSPTTSASAARTPLMPT